jgi:Na+:H+ antiporter, NhaA family
MKQHISMLRELSIPLIGGVFVALCWANLDLAGYEQFLHAPFLGGMTFHFATNDLFMAFFFALAAGEITQSCLPGGDLYPLQRAINPLLGTLGGVLGPIVVYLLLNRVIGAPELQRGWGIPTATDIALAWLAARLIFGDRHPAISYLLLLAIVDDGIGLAIIAIFYPDPAHPLAPGWLALVVLGMACAYALRRLQVKSYWPYILLGGGLAWTGLFRAHLHPALALVFIVPFLPHAKRETVRIFEENPEDRSTLGEFEHHWKVVVDFGLFMFGLANAGVVFSSVGTPTLLVLSSLLIGKTSGIFLLGLLAHKFGFLLPQGIRLRHLLVVGLIAGTGMTVALFVAGEAFTDPATLGAARMGALLSGVAGFLAFILARNLKIYPKRS